MKEYLDREEKEMFLFLEKLVNTESGSHNKKGVDQIGAILRKCYEELGFNVKTIYQEEFGNHLVLHHKKAVNPKVLILSHLDTVFPEGTVKDRPFSIKGNRAYGPGVIDMKASLVSVYYALKALDLSGSQSIQNVVIVMNSDEEVGSTTSRSLIEKLAGGKDFALVMEPARKDGSLVSARRGKGNYTLEVQGKAAHSGIEPEKGRSAIEELAHKVIQFHELSDHENGISVNIGLIEGGSSANTVSDHAIAQVDVRISSLNQVEFLEEKMEEICSLTDVPGTKILLEGEINRPPMAKNKKSSSLLDIITDVGKEIGVDIEDTSTGGGSDASFTSAMGIATIDGLGPIGGNAHSDKEYLEIPSLKERTLLLAKVIERLSE
ncbi:M20 family metallopeptidase [Bacillus sp. 2205SS5-2]|uniref:M20 family metallopeptidase n=1 Tax=Bacillus sp. 2205SS5-2 TaxID=3109031 RepID=UPI00300530FA